jgi:type I restriction enzyme S subunit
MSESKQKRTRQLPKGWKYYSIGDFADTSSGGTPLSTKKEYYENGDIPWINSGEVNQTRIKKAEKYITKLGLENSSAKIFPKNTVLVAMYGATAGKTSILDIEATTNQAICGIFPNEKYNSEFLKYSLDFLYEYLVGISSGSARDNLSQTGIQELRIPMPDLPTQQKIAAVLSALDAKIELNQRINAELESMAKTLYDYWFVQFDFPNEKGKPYKSAGGKMVWNEELGKEIPQGWDVKPLGKALKTNLGGTPSTKNAEYWENATIPWLNSGDLSNFPIISSSSFVTRKGIENSATTILPKGSVVISLVRYIRPSIIALEACANQSVVGILETDKLKNTFIYPYLVNEVPRLMALRTGAQQPHINKETIDETLLCIPPANILGQYYKISEPIYKKIINLAFESQTLTELRGWLLPLLMNGQVKV